MCKTAFFMHPFCGCRWLQVMQPCGPGMGLSTCPFLLSSAFEDRAAPPPPVYGLKESTIKKLKKDFEKTRSKNNTSIFSSFAFAQMDPDLAVWSNIPCPEHTLGCYDRNYTRMVIDVKNGVRWGLGPNKTDPGIECQCSVM